MAKRKKDDGLDTETSFADMNVEGFRWYDPHAKARGKKEKVKITRKEYWAMVKGAYAAFLPVFIIVILAFIAVFVIAWLWLRP